MGRYISVHVIKFFIWSGIIQSVHNLLIYALLRAGGGPDMEYWGADLRSAYLQVYGGEKGGTISTIPMVAESMLKHDDFTTTFSNGSFFIMEG